VTRRLALALLLLAAPAWAQTVVRVKDNAGNVVCELTIPAGGGVEVIHPGPGPNPPPPPPPPPNPAPNAGPVKHLVVIRDDTPGAMSGPQLASLRDPQVRAAVAQRGWAWHVFDVNSAEVQQPKAQGGKGYVKWLNNPNFAPAPNLKVPCIFLLDNDGRPARAFPLPADSAGFIAALGI
jgi:hypothetical protein